MRKTTLSIIVLSALLSGAMIISSCGDDDDEIEDDGGKTEIPDDKTAMTPQAQKQYLETVATEFMNTVPSSDFDNLADLGKFISDEYMEQYEWDAVEDWGKDIMDELRGSTYTQDTETEGNEYWTYTYVYKNYKALIQASNFTGHFTANNGQWTLKEAKDLQFIFNDESGKECVLKLETSGNVKKVHMLDIEDWQDYESDYNKNTTTEYYDRTAYTVGLPEKIEVTLSRGGSNVVKTTVKIDLSGISGEEFDLSKNKLSLSCTTEFENGYKLDLSQVAYNGNKNASVSTVLSKNGKNLITIAVAADITGLPSYNVSAFSSLDEDEEDYDEDYDDENDEDDKFKDANVKNAFVKIDILGKLQMQGKIDDIRKFSDYLESAEDNDGKETQFKSYINQANSLMNIGLFYDGKNVKQADVKFEPFMENDGYESYWDYEPVLNFYDGSSYSTFEAFFNDTDFKSVIDTFQDLTDQYSNLLDTENR